MTKILPAARPVLALLLSAAWLLAQVRAQEPTGRTRRPALAPRPTELTVTAPCAVLYSPDDARIARMKKAGEDGFYTVADDASYYQAGARECLHKYRIKTIHTYARRVRFVLPGGAPPRIVNLTDGWGLWLFNGRTAPVEGDLTDPEFDVRRVFGK